MPDELSELQENAEHGRENPSLAPISVTMAILAVCVAVVSLMGHRSHTEELLTQNRATDQWAYYQAKNIRRHNYEMSIDLLALVEFKDKEQAEKVRAKYQAKRIDTRKSKPTSRRRPKILRANPPAHSEGGPLRSGRGVSGNCAGDFLAGAAFPETNFLVSGSGFGCGWSRDRRHRPSDALNRC